MGLTTSKSAAAATGGKTTSSSAIDSETATETGSVTIQVAGYKRTKGIGVGKSINSCKFHVGGHTWYVAYYSDGDRLELADWISVFVYLDQPAAAADVVTAEFVFSLLDGNGDTVHMKYPPSPVTFSFVHGYTQRWGYGRFIERKNMESCLWSCLRLGGERFGIRCDIAVITRGRRCCREAAASSSSASTVVVPPLDLHRHLGGLLASGVGADVHFMVSGKLFRAHRNVLAARSPVFMAGLFGGRVEETGSPAYIEVDDMDPST
uniref:BTB domain-containing protein n=1 Tax=Oryza punctata TaxID=4537 RepID=A0A0E0MI71_ORYPU